MNNKQEADKVVLINNKNESKKSLKFKNKNKHKNHFIKIFSLEFKVSIFNLIFLKFFLSCLCLFFSKFSFEIKFNLFNLNYNIIITMINMYYFANIKQLSIKFMTKYCYILLIYSTSFDELKIKNKINNNNNDNFIKKLLYVYDLSKKDFISYKDSTSFNINCYSNSYILKILKSFNCLYINTIKVINNYYYNKPLFTIFEVILVIINLIDINNSLNLIFGYLILLIIIDIDVYNSILNKFNLKFIKNSKIFKKLCNNLITNNSIMLLFLNVNIFFLGFAIYNSSLNNYFISLKLYYTIVYLYKLILTLVDNNNSLTYKLCKYEHINLLGNSLIKDIMNKDLLIKLKNKLYSVEKDLNKLCNSNIKLTYSFKDITIKNNKLLNLDLSIVNILKEFKLDYKYNKQDNCFLNNSLYDILKNINNLNVKEVLDLLISNKSTNNSLNSYIEEELINNNVLCLGIFSLNLNEKNYNRLYKLNILNFIKKYSDNIDSKTIVLINIKIKLFNHRIFKNTNESKSTNKNAEADNKSKYYKNIDNKYNNNSYNSNNSSSQDEENIPIVLDSLFNNINIKNTSITNKRAKYFSSNNKLTSYFLLFEDVTYILKNQSLIIEDKYQNLILSKLSHEIKTSNIGISYILNEIYDELNDFKIKKIEDILNQSNKTINSRNMHIDNTNNSNTSYVNNNFCTNANTYTNFFNHAGSNNKITNYNQSPLEDILRKESKKKHNILSYSINKINNFLTNTIGFNENQHNTANNSNTNRIHYDESNSNINNLNSNDPTLEINHFCKVNNILPNNLNYLDANANIKDTSLNVALHKYINNLSLEFNNLNNKLLSNFIRLQILSDMISNSMTQISDYIKGIYKLKANNEIIELKELFNWSNFCFGVLLDIYNKQDVDCQIECDKNIIDNKINIDLIKFKSIIIESLKNSIEYSNNTKIQILITSNYNTVLNTIYNNNNSLIDTTYKHYKRYNYNNIKNKDIRHLFNSNLIIDNNLRKESKSVEGSSINIIKKCNLFNELLNNSKYLIII